MGLNFQLRKKLKSGIENNQFTVQQLNSYLELKNCNPIYDFLNDKKDTFQDFGALIRLVKGMFPEEEYDLMSDYILLLDPNKHSQVLRCGMEYADVNQLDELADEVAYRLLNSSNNHSKEWGSIYTLHRKLSKGEMEIHDAIRQTGRIRIHTPEMLVFSNAMLMYAYLNIGDFHLLKSTFDLLDIDELPEGYVKESYYGRAALLHANVSLNENDILSARHYSSYVLEKANNDRFMVFGHLTSGNTYVFEDYDKAKDHYLKGLQYANTNPFHYYKLRLALCFLNNVWKKENKWVDFESNEITDRIEVAYYYVNQNEDQKAIKVFQELDNRKIPKDDLGFLFYVKGLLHQEKSYFYESIEYFKKSGDKMFVNLPLMELKKQGENERLLQLLTI
ncbi:AimR family lysis-lysogeny pheromone receptor [Bacillus subtilis]|uniref:AimR family lysis-lysogeny pheromone receptor n=1 Tax=Bacteria TaxID=2 RepID=UPI002368B87E|nr:AimR family lysis-lysogeny pheromone receptor [Bacillus subtilis]MED4874589.1 AimR family lysis-lysogeny pheromone receptor [Bacillus subtilis]WDI23834.1 AimR family lysis-lysogeny pheromone receptor [Bacillus subtilis]